MSVFLALLLALGLAGAAVVYALCRWLEIPMPWEVKWTTAAEAATSFTCEACGTGPWHISWDPHEQPVMGRRGGRICPNCSGAS